MSNFFEQVTEFLRIAVAHPAVATATLVSSLLPTAFACLNVGGALGTDVVSRRIEQKMDMKFSQILSRFDRYDARIDRLEETVREYTLSCEDVDAHNEDILRIDRENARRDKSMFRLETKLDRLQLAERR